jgi:hypothetical protein
VPGEEIVVAKVAAGAAKKALSENQTTTQALVELAKGLPEMHEAAELYAKRLVVRQSLIAVLYRPVARLLGFGSDYFQSGRFDQEMAEKTADIPEEHLVTPQVAIAAPSLLALTYLHEEADLKEMYLNLLAAATDDRRKDDAHPSFAEIIKQIAPNEARPLQNALSVAPRPLARIVSRDAVPSLGRIILMDHLADWHDLIDDQTLRRIEQPLGPLWIDNWVRLGLMSVSYSDHFTNESLYSWVSDRPEFLKFKQSHDGVDGRTVEFERGMYRRTDFGTRFYRAIAPATTGYGEPASEG